MGSIKSIRYRLSAVGYPLSAIRYPLSAVDCRLSTEKVYDSKNFKKYFILKQAALWRSVWGRVSFSTCSVVHPCATSWPSPLKGGARAIRRCPFFEWSEHNPLPAGQSPFGQKGRPPSPLNLLNQPAKGGPNPLNPGRMAAPMYHVTNSI